MERYGLRAPIILLFLVISLSVFFSGQFFYHKYNVQEPLESVFKNNKNIATFTIKEEKQVYEINLTLKDKHEDLKDVFQAVDKNAKEILGKTPYEIAFLDKTDNSLDIIWQKSELIIYQAMMQGNFVDMNEKINTLAKKDNASADISLDDENIYVELNKNDGHNLIQIVSRPSNIVILNGVSAGGAASDQRN